MDFFQKIKGIQKTTQNNKDRDFVENRFIWEQKMNIRENLEYLEKENLSPYAAHSVDSKGECVLKSSVISDPFIKETETEFFIQSLFED